MKKKWGIGDWGIYDKLYKILQLLFLNQEKKNRQDGVINLHPDDFDI